MDATGTKQDWNGSGRSARREAVRNRPCRLPGGGTFRLTGLPELDASEGNEPHERCRESRPQGRGKRRPELVQASKGRQGHGRMGTDYE